MRHFLFPILFMAGIIPAVAQQAPVKQEPPKPEAMTINDCLLILQGLNALDAGYRYIVAQGKPTESAETIRFKFPGKVRDAISHDIFVLGPVQQEAQANNRRVQLELMAGGSDQIKSGSKENLIFDQRMTEYTARPCQAQLDHIRASDLDTEHNDIPGSILALLTKILDR